MMKTPGFEGILRDSPFAMAHHEIVRDFDHHRTDFRFLEVNSAFEKMTGLAAESIQGKTVGELGLGGHWDRLYQRATLNEAGWPFEECFDHLGHSFHVSAYMRDECFLTAWFVDISELKRAEAALRESEQHFRTLANGGMALIWTADQQKLCDYFNEGWLRFTGRSFEQEYGHGWTDGLHPADLELCLARYAESFKRRETFVMEYRLRHADGGYRWVADHGSPRYDSNGNFIGYIGFCYDVTERKTLDHALKMLNGPLAKLGGEDFFREACVCLSETLGVEYAFAGKLDSESRRIQVIAGWGVDQALVPFTYDLAGTPCEKVMEDEFCCYLHSVQASFPHDAMLSEMGIASYVGSPLYDKTGQPIGLLAALGRRALPPTSEAISGPLLAVFVDRVSSELQRTDAELQTRFQLDFQRIAADASSALVNASGEDEFNGAIDLCLARLGRLFSVDRSYVFQFSENLAEMSNTHEWCAEGISPQKHTLQDVAVDEVPWWTSQVLSHGVVIVRRVDDLPEAAAREKAIFTQQSIQSLITFCMYGAQGKLTGFFGFDSVLKPRTWPDEQIAMLKVMAGVIGSAIERRRGEKVLRENEERLRLSMKAARQGYYDIDLKTGEAVVSPEYAEMLGYDPVHFKETNAQWLERLHPSDRAGVTAAFARYIEGRDPEYRLEFRQRCADGSWKWILSIGSVVERTEDGTPRRMLGTHTDISAEKQSEEKLKQAANVFTHANEGIMITDADGVILDVNMAFTAITGYTAEDVLGKKPRVLASGRQGKAFYRDLWKTLEETGHWSGEVWNTRKDGEAFAEFLTISAVRDTDDTVRQYVALFSDITVLKKHQQALEHLANFDALTNLPNRSLLSDRLQQAMTDAQRRGEQIAVVYLDLDGFKSVNDNYGHDAGDRLLIAVTGRLKQALRKGDTLARLGGDECVAVLRNVPNVEACDPLLMRLLAAAAEPVSDNENLLQVSASLGVSFFPQEEPVDADQILRQADQAMYQAKLAGKNRYHIFDAEHDRSLRGRHESLERIREALAKNEFVLYYQPKVNLRNGQVIGAEALIRWRHPQQGLKAPGEFLQLLENHPLSIDLGDWVIESALSQIAGWRAAGLALPVSVNIDAIHFAQSNFVEKLSDALSRNSDVLPGDLELELLETNALQDIVQTANTIRACQELGVHFALDDFGSGYSSLTYLKRLPAETIKIDQSFVRDMLDNPDDLAILQGVLGLAKAFQRKVIAEGIETAEHGEMLLLLGCELGQGYAIARPMPAENVPEWVGQWRPCPSWRDTLPVGHKDPSVLFAMVEHRSWIGSLKHYLNDERLHPPMLDHKRCRFGLWLETSARTRYAGHPALSRVDGLHQSIHADAETLVNLAKTGNTSAARSGFPDIESRCKQLLEALCQLLE